MRITEQDRQRIERAVLAAESRTGGELVMVIARSSDPYLFIPLFWVSFVAMTLPGLLYPFGVDPGYGYLIQLLAFSGLAILSQWTPLKMRLIPRKVKRRRAGRLAREQFFEHGLHLTGGRSGILVFVSLAEHYVEIIADAGIDSKVPDDAWNGIVASFVDDVRAGKVTEGFEAAARSAGDLLAQHCPTTQADRDELPNRLVVLN